MRRKSPPENMAKQVDGAELKVEDNSESDNEIQKKYGACSQEELQILLAKAKEKQANIRKQLADLKKKKLEERSQGARKEKEVCESRNVRKKRKLLGKEDIDKIVGEGLLPVASVASNSLSSEELYRMSRSSEGRIVLNHILLDLPDPSESVLAQCFPGKIWSNSIGPL